MSNTNPKNLFSVMSDLEENTFSLERVQDLLQIYDEFLGNELGCLRESKDPFTHVFVNRLHLLQSQMEAIRFQLRVAVERTTEAVQEGYAIDRSLRGAANCI